MDYKKKYVEALGRAKEILESEDSSEESRECCRKMFPDLKRSEDERIRKAIESIIRVYGKTQGEWIGGYDMDTLVVHLREAFSALEKQKENPKSANSIPSDCVSDAKCNDRWHKVEDSLPDNGREVLAKDKLGNTILARYDGEKWDVSVYDDEDYCCHNGISKWCEIPSEKQKEPHYTKRNALFDKCVENCDPETVEEVNKRVDDIMNMPELSAFEQALTNFIGYWEDDEERWPSKFVKKHSKHILDMAREELQKEQIPYIDFVIKPHKGDDSNPYDMRVSEAQEYAIKRGFDIPLNDCEVYVDERHMTQTIGNILRWADEHPKEQKPAEWSEENEKMRQRILTHLYSFIYPNSLYGEDASECISWLKSLPERFNLQPKQEWSEEDKKKINGLYNAVILLRDLVHTGELKSTDRYKVENYYEELASWLKSLRLQSCWKPSEEQINALGRAIVKAHTPHDIGVLAVLRDNLKKLMI